MCLEEREVLKVFPLGRGQMIYLGEGFIGGDWGHEAPRQINYKINLINDSFQIFCQQFNSHWLNRGSWVRLPRETNFISRIEKPEHSIEYYMYHLIPHHILINFQENGK